MTHTLWYRLQVADRLIVLVNVILITVRHATHRSDLLTVHLMVLVCVFVKRSWNVLSNVGHLNHLFVLALLDAWHWGHDGSCDALAAAFPQRNIDTIGQRVLHIPIVHLLHVRLVFQVGRYEIRVTIAALLLLILQIEIIARNTRNVLQVMQRWNLWHLGRQWR